MDLYCVMGHPVEHSRSPWIHARFAEITGEPIHYTRRLIPLDGFRAGVAAFRAEGGRGCNITVPFKFEAGEVATRMSPAAALARAANVLSFETDGGIAADNTDGPGLVHDITVNAGVPIEGRRVLLLGAGGAGAGVLGPLLRARPSSLCVANRTSARAAELVARHQAVANEAGVDLRASSLEALDQEAGHSCDIVINATASSLSGEQIPLPGRLLATGALACDLMYGPAADGFIRWAQAHGAQGRDGLGMLVEQAALAFEIWRGVRPPTGDVLAELRELVR